MAPPVVLGSLYLSGSKPQVPEKSAPMWIDMEDDGKGGVPRVASINGELIGENAVSFATYTRLEFRKFGAGSRTQVGSKELLSLLATSGQVEAAIHRLLESTQDLKKDTSPAADGDGISSPSYQKMHWWSIRRFIVAFLALYKRILALSATGK